MTMKVEIDVRGFKGFARNLRGADEVIQSNLNRMLRDIGSVFVPVLRALTPRKTGALANATRSQILGMAMDQRLEVRQGAKSKGGQFYGHFVRSGTRAHVIRPVKARALAFDVGGVTVFAMKVNHPGTTPNPYHKRALRQVQGAINDIVQQTGTRIVRRLASLGAGER